MYTFAKVNEIVHLKLRVSFLYYTTIELSLSAF